MKQINNYIQEKLVINKNIKASPCTYDSLLAKYPSLKKNQNESNKLVKVLNGDEKLLDLYSQSFKELMKYNSTQEIHKITQLISVKCSVSITTINNNQDQWYDIIVTDDDFLCLFEIVFNQKTPIIKIYLSRNTEENYSKEINNNFINDGAKVIDFILSYKK